MFQELIKLNYDNILNEMKHATVEIVRFDNFSVVQIELFSFICLCRQKYCLLFENDLQCCIVISGRSAMMPCILCWVITAIVSVPGPICFYYNDVYKWCMLWFDETELNVTVLHNNVPRRPLFTDIQVPIITSKLLFQNQRINTTKNIINLWVIAMKIFRKLHSD